MSSARSGMHNKSNMYRGNVRSQNVSSSSVPISPSGERFIPHLSRTPISDVGPLVRSRSNPSLKHVNEDAQGGTKVSFFQSVGLGERTPVTHFCTPCQSGSGHLPSDDHSKTKLVSQKQLSDQHHRIPLKRFYSEVNLHKVSATPDCFKKVHMETRRNKGEPEDVPVLLGEETSNLTVGVRVRPLIMREQNDASVVTVVSVDGNEVKVMCESGMAYTFTYDYCFWSCDPEHPRFASQDIVFSTMVQPLIDKAFLGYNACLFAYGQTGSGKSYSMMGIDIDVGNSIGKETGIIPRFCHELFKRIVPLDNSDVGAGKSTSSSAKVEVSYFEIYNEKIHDLLAGSYDGGKRTPLKVREHPVFGPYVVDLSVHEVTSYEDLQGWLTVGNSQRATATTGMNEKSSRSHSIFSIIMTQMQEETMEGGDYHKQCRHSKINLVDLAGSERLSHTCTSGDRLREGVSINRSLLTLGKVITALAENGTGKKKSFVPYRDSVLTWLLRESLGGNSRTMMLATISPANIHLEETLATLRYACQAGTIVNRVRINEDPQGRLIRELQAEIERLRAERQMKMGVPRRLLQSDKIEINNGDDKTEALKEQLRQSEELVKDQISWTERLEEAGKQKSAELNYLQRCGLALQFDWKQRSPCLVNLKADPSLSGTLFYLLPPGVVCIGRLDITTEDQQPDITLSGPLVQPHHCTIENKDFKLTLIPGCDGETFVNGAVAKERTGLQHGDRVVIGGNHYFRVSNPYESSTTATEQLADYEFAHQEILRIQEEKLHAELDEAKRQAIQELEESKKDAEREIGFQRMNYKQQLKQMGITLEEQRYALADIQSKKDELERQKKMLEVAVQKRNTVQETATDFIVTPYSSNFLQEVEAALNETVLETGNIQKQETRLCNSSDCIGLHELVVAVQEANQLCKELGINFEFFQQHIIGESGLAVRVRDTHKHMAAFWKAADFMEWLCQLRDYESTDNLKELLNIDVTWQDDYWNGNSEGAAAHISSQVSLNIHQIKQELNDSIQHLSMELSSCNDSALESSRNSFSMSDNTSTAGGTDYSHSISNCLKQMEIFANRLRKLCKNRREPEKANETLDSLQGNIQQLRSVLGTSHDHEQPFIHQCDSSRDSPKLLGNNLQKRYFLQPPSHDPPKRSNLRSPCSTPSSRTQKAVRFFLTTSQQDQTCE